MTASDPMLTVQRAGDDDWQTWGQLRIAALSTNPDAFGSALMREQHFEAEDWQRQLDALAGVLAWLADRPVGMGGSFLEHEGARVVVAMWVDPSARGHGVGRVILRHVVQEALTDVEQVTLWVADGNPARALYESEGFVDTGDRAPIRPGARLMKSRLALPGPTEP